MPRFTRPAWVDLTIENSNGDRHVSTGPNARMGRIAAQFSIRNQGSVHECLKIYTGEYCPNGTNLTFIEVAKNTGTTNNPKWENIYREEWKA